MQKYLSFDDVLLSPQFSMVNSRADVDTSQWFCGTKLGLPIISSNMDTVTNSNMARAMNEHGATSALHRFQSIEDNVTEFKNSPNTTIGSFGLGKKELERAIELSYANCNTLLLDIAHGASMEAVNQVKALRLNVGIHKNIIVGNFANARSIKDFLYHLGNNNIQAVKVGIGGGSGCTTRVQTGSGAPTFSSVVDCVRVGLPVISDGGHKTIGDICKALAAGAHTVMLGKMIAGTNESPGEVVRKVRLSNDLFLGPFEYSGWETLSDIQLLKEATALCKHLPGPRRNQVGVSIIRYKKYRGSASQESYEVQGKVANHRVAEGESFLIPYVGSVSKVLQEISGGLRSAMSYSGAFNLDEFRERADFIEITNAGIVENSSHGRKNV